MSGIDERKKGMDYKLQHDSEMRFKATVRRNKLLGLWAAELMGKSGDDAKAYAQEVVKADFEEVGDEDVIRKVMGDFEANGVNMDDKTLRAKIEELMHTATEQILAEA